MEAHKGQRLEAEISGVSVCIRTPFEFLEREKTQQVHVSQNDLRCDGDRAAVNVRQE